MGIKASTELGRLPVAICRPRDSLPYATSLILGEERFNLIEDACAAVDGVLQLALSLGRDGVLDGGVHYDFLVEKKDDVPQLANLGAQLKGVGFGLTHVDRESMDHLGQLEGDAQEPGASCRDGERVHRGR